MLASRLHPACLLFFLLSVMDPLLLSVPGARQVPLVSATASRGPLTYSALSGPLWTCTSVQLLLHPGLGHPDNRIGTAVSSSLLHPSASAELQTVGCYHVGAGGGTQVLCRTSQRFVMTEVPLQALLFLSTKPAVFTCVRRQWFTFILVTRGYIRCP